MGIYYHIIDVVTDGSGDFAYETPRLHGEIMHISYIPGSNLLPSSTDLIITGAISGIPVVADLLLGTSAFTISYQIPAQSASGTTITNSHQKIAINEPLSFVIDNAGPNDNGRFIITMKE